MVSKHHYASLYSPRWFMQVLGCTEGLGYRGNGALFTQSGHYLCPARRYPIVELRSEYFNTTVSINPIQAYKVLFGSTFYGRISHMNWSRLIRSKA